MKIFYPSFLLPVFMLAGRLSNLRFLVIFLLVTSSIFVSAQDTIPVRDTTLNTSPAADTLSVREPIETEALSPSVKSFQDTVPRGVSVSPSSVRFYVKTGSSQSKKLNVFNDTDFERTFQVLMSDYNATDINRAAANSQTEKDYKYGLSKWVSITPSLLTLKPGERGTINVTLDVPAGEEHKHAAWSIVVVEEVKERPQLDVPSQSSAVGLGISATMGFGIFVYQNPPDLPASEIEMTGYRVSEDRKNLFVKVQNAGEGIGYCTYYVELLNMATGQAIKLPSGQATMLPGANREIKIDLPELQSGSYNALAVIDFGSKEFVETAELDFTVP